MFKNRFNGFKKTIYLLLVSMIALPISLLGTEAEKALAAASEGDVIINEVMWMGSSKSSVDEWIELRNTTISDIDISGWTIKGAAANDGDLIIPANQIISANGYYLISNYNKDHDNSALDVDVNWQTSDISLSNSELRLTLYDNGNPSGIIDTAGYGNAPPAGDNNNKYSMERSDPPGGALDQNWHNANNRQGFDSGVIDRGTPGTENSDPNVDVSEPTNNTISPGSPSKDNTPAVTGEVNPLGVNSVEMILDNGVTKTLLSDTDVSSGNYEITPGTGLADGTYDIIVADRNAEGLFSETVSVVNNYLIDTQAPVLASSSPANGETLTSSPTQITATFAEDDSGIDESGLGMTINGNPVASSYDNASKTLTYVIPTALNSGTYTVEITGLKDLAGNLASPNPSFQFTVAIPSVTLPSSEITNPDGHTRSSEFNLEVQTSENTAGLYLYYNKDGKGWTQYGGLYTVVNPNVRTYITFRSKENGLGDGNYGFYTRAVDKNNNMEGEPAFPDLNVTVDTNPPAVPVGYMVPGSPSMDSTPTAMGEISSDTYRVWLEITSHATGDKIIVNGSLIDNKRYEAAPNAEQVLADGAYQIIAFAEDYLGNGSMYVIATDYVIDTVGAEVPAGLKAVGGAGEVYLEWQAMEGISNYLLKYRKIGEDYGEPMLILGQNNTQIIGLENGIEYEFAAASVDSAGNISEYSTVKVLIKIGQISTADGAGAAPGQYPSGGPATASAAAKGPEVIAVPAKEKPAAKTEEEVTQPEQKEGEPAEITPIQPEETEEGQVKAEETKTTRNWTRIIVAISILIIAIGVGTGGWYGYQWLTERGKSDTGIKGMDEKKDDKDKKDEDKPNEPGGRW